MLLTDADRKERIARIQQSMRSFPRALEPFLPLQQQFATRNNVDTTRTCHATPLWHARAFSSENSWDRLTELGKAYVFSRIGWRRRTLRTLAHHGLPVRPIPRWQTSGCAGGSAIEPHRCLFARSEAFFASFNGLLAGGHRHAPELLGVSGVYSQYAVLILGAY